MGAFDKAMGDWEKNQKRLKEKASAAASGSCHNCGHRGIQGLGEHVCKAPLPRAVLLREWQIVKPGESTITDCRVWKLQKAALEAEEEGIDEVDD